MHEAKRGTTLRWYLAFNLCVFSIHSFASKIPTKSTGRKIQPHEIAIYKRSQISDSTSIYFKGWRHHETDGCVVRNLEKTKKLLGDEAYRFCKEHNISSCWGKNPSDRINYYPPNEYQKKR